VTKRKFKRVALDLHHVGDWLASQTPDDLRALLGRGEPVGAGWFIDVLGAAEISLRDMREALVCVSLVGGLPLSEVHNFATPKSGYTWDTMPSGCACRVQDYALRALKKCGAVAFDKVKRAWIVTPCVWVEAAQ
jgi:hypothetical protein